MAEKENHYFGLKEFGEFAKDAGIINGENVTRIMSVYNRRGILPKPVVTIGSKEGWTKKQIEKWIKERKKDIAE